MLAEQPRLRRVWPVVKYTKTGNFKPAASYVSKGALDLIETEQYLFSTNGHQTKHPHLEGVARTIVRGGEPTLFFNYKVETTAPWDDRRLQRNYKYRAVYPEAGADGLTVDL